MTTTAESFSLTETAAALRVHLRCLLDGLLGPAAGKAMMKRCTVRTMRYAGGSSVRANLPEEVRELMPRDYWRNVELSYCYGRFDGTDDSTSFVRFTITHNGRKAQPGALYCFLTFNGASC